MNSEAAKPLRTNQYLAMTAVQSGHGYIDAFLLLSSGVCASLFLFLGQSKL